jgi:hypothetical protein
MTTEARARRRRVHQDPTLARHVEMSLIQCGWETLEALHRFRWLTSWQVAKLFFLGYPSQTGEPRGDEAARKATNERCLRRLKDRQLVETRQAILPHKSHMMRREYHVLTRSGFLLLRDHLVARSRPVPEWDPDRHNIQPEALEHALGLNDVAIALLRGCEDRGGRILAWIDEFVRLSQAGHVHFSGFRPDAAALVELDGGRSLYLIEVDRGTEPVEAVSANSWQTKMEHYLPYLKEGFAQDPFFAGQPAPLLLVITTSPTRLHHLMTTTAAVGLTDLAWFTCAGWIESPADALGPVWRRAHAPDHAFALLDHLALRAAFASA